MAPCREVVAYAPGRVNLIGDHTDYTGGLVFPMAIQFGTTFRLAAGGHTLSIESDSFPGRPEFSCPVRQPAAVEPGWGRYVAGVAALLGRQQGGRARVTGDLPAGAGLSSSAALEVSAALALGFDGPPQALAELCQRAEQLATGVPCGIMDQLASAAGIEGHALLIDCATAEHRPVPVPPAAEFVVVHSGQVRELAGSPYAERRAQCEAAGRLIGPLRQAEVADLDRIPDAVVRRRARHVLTENLRVMEFAERLSADDLAGAGELMKESHASLRLDFEVSTAPLDALVEDLAGRPGVHGARLTGAGFGGCVVALTNPGALDVGWRVRASRGARVLSE